MYNKYDIAVAAAVAVVVVVLIILLWAWDTGRLGRFSRGAGSSQDPDPAPTRVNVKTDAQQFADAETDAQTVLGGGNAPDVSSACGGLVWRIDVGMSAHYGGAPSVLEIDGGEVRALPRSN